MGFIQNVKSFLSNIFNYTFGFFYRFKQNREPELPGTRIPSEYIRKRKPRAPSKGEQFMRESFEDLLGRRVLFNYRPNILKNPITGKNLELDCYDHVSKIAVEYNGKQHYHFSKRFHKTIEDFQAQIWRDELKKMLCVQNGIVLISISYEVDANCRGIERKERIYNYLSEKLEPFLRQRN